MNDRKNLVIDAAALEAGRFAPDAHLGVHIGRNTLVVLPERMTAMEAVNAIHTLDGLIHDLLGTLKSACGACQDQGDGCLAGRTDPLGRCPYEEHHGPRVVLRDDVRAELGIGPDVKLDCFVDEGEALVTAASHRHDINDVPERVRVLLTIAGVCPGRLDGLLMDEAEVWHG